MTVLINGTNGLIQAYDYQVPTTGFSYTFAAGTQTLVMNPAGTLATGTITMPTAPSDGMTITFSSTQQITALTLNGGAGQTIIGGVNSLGAEQSLSFIYRLANTTWFPMTTQVAQGTGPAFSVARTTSNQNIPASTWTKIQFQTEEFDTNNNFDSTTNYRFTPTVAGYYQINLSPFVSFSSGGPSVVGSSIYKNGALYKIGFTNGSGFPYGSLVTAAVVYMNGSTDYIEGYVFSNSSAAVLIAGSSDSYMTGALIRSA
jgi:hypothetical protein